LPTLGTAAALNVGTTASQVVQLTAAGKLPAVDGSLLTGLASGGVTSLVAGNGITVSGATGAVTVSQDIYTGSTASNTSYPIGTVIKCKIDSGSSVLNGAVIPKVNSGSPVTFDTAATTTVTGTWRTRYGFSGSCGGVVLLQRTA